MQLIQEHEQLQTHEHEQEQEQVQEPGVLIPVVVSDIDPTADPSIESGCPGVVQLQSALCA
ncbi:MAG: hypothetical protein HYT10_01890 [Candidatus Levybacteria bacterium]|nr:hypothetical protein [Candidatus Levybacteria bacterium]